MRQTTNLIMDPQNLHKFLKKMIKSTFILDFLKFVSEITNF